MISRPVQWVKGSSFDTFAAYVAAVAQIQYLAWELPYAEGVALKKNGEFPLWLSG